MWSVELTIDYWAEVDREAATEWALAQHASDPLGVRYGRLEAVPTWPVDLDPPDYLREDGEDWWAVWDRVLSLLPDVDVEALGLAYTGRDGVGGRGGRGGDGEGIAAALGLSQPGWWRRLTAAETRAGVVAPFAREGVDRASVLAATGERDRGLVAAYLRTWNTAAAAREAGVAQTTAWGRLVKVGGVVEAMLRRPPMPRT